MASNEKARAEQLNQRAVFYGRPATETLTIYDIRGLLAFFNRTCSKCGKQPATSPNHVKPLTEGGTNTVDNLDLLCLTCNKAEGAKGNDYRNGRILTAEYCQQFYPTEKATKETYKKHDWDALQFEYVTGELSLRELAQKHSIDASLVLKRAAAERWLKEREKFAINLLSGVQQEAKAKGVTSRVMILEAARIALEEWQGNDTKTDTAQLAKILELAARVEGLELDKRRVITQDYKDAASEHDTDDINTYATKTADAYFGAAGTDGDREAGAGWTD